MWNDRCLTSDETNPHRCCPRIGIHGRRDDTHWKRGDGTEVNTYSTARHRCRGDTDRVRRKYEQHRVRQGAVLETAADE